MADPKTSFDELYDKIENAVKNLTTLKVVTAVGDVTISQSSVTEGDTTRETRSENYQNAKAILSTIDLIDGDIMPVMDEVFAKDTVYASIRDDHMERIKSAQEIVNQNVQTLLALVKAVGDILEAVSTQKQAKQTASISGGGT
ncbi:MAG: hypothetical protein M3Q16_10375 [Pseudomonadota bacterium]|nr:hypothetical protein [Pseudomonadota bacterium]